MTINSRVQNIRYTFLVGTIVGIGAVNNPLGRHFYVKYDLDKSQTVLESQRDLREIKELDVSEST
jgi:hypothetical protein